MDNNALLNWCKLLLDERRLRVLGLLATNALTPPQIASQSGLKAQEIVHHLVALDSVHLLARTETSGGPAYQLDVKALQAAKKELFSFEIELRKASLPAELSAEQRELLYPYLQGAKLLDIPHKEKPLLAMLEWLAGKFAPNERYSEKQVNELLKEFHPDFASLRRYLVDSGLLGREKGVYWRSSREKPLGLVVE